MLEKGGDFKNKDYKPKSKFPEIKPKKQEIQGLPDKRKKFKDVAKSLMSKY